jgi:hypothetical protein
VTDVVSITTWTRLETRQRSDDLDVALAARVHDPLWLLARQWQMGEFRGHDSGSLVKVTMRATVGHLDRYLAGVPDADAAQRARRYDDVLQPLEAVAEAEPLTSTTAPRLSVEAGAHFLRLLADAELGRYRDGFVSAFGPGTLPAPRADPAGGSFHDLVARRVPDGLSLRAATLATGDPIVPEEAGVDDDDVSAVLEVITRWLQWFDPLVGLPPAEDAWVPARLEHAFATAATVGGVERVLLSGEYSSGRLDWPDFGVAVGAALGSDGAAETVIRTLLPAPVTFPGMPAPRWWAFEDGKVDLSAIDSGADGIARMLMVGFAVDYGNDWFVVPIELPVGSLTRIEGLDVTDTFGVRTRIRSAADVDGDGARWRMFQLTGADDASDELLFLPPVLAVGLDGPARERVAIARDELANLAWAVEDLVESSTGRAHRREEEVQPPGPPRGLGDVLSYEVVTAVPAHWHPLVAVPEQSGATMLELRQLQPPTGTLLSSGLRVFEEEIPGEGLGVERAYQLARWLGGRTAIWSSRRRMAGRGPTSSGLRFDNIARLRA